MAQEWNIKARGHECGRCGKPFEDGSACISCLKFAPAEGSDSPVVTRIDLCEKCEEPEDETFISFWRGKYHAPEPPEKDPASKQTVETLLRKLMEGENSIEMQPAIYLLAVILERKRILIERTTKQQDDGTLIRVYEFRKTGEVLLVQDPCLQLNQLKPVQEMIAALLNAEEHHDDEPPTVEAQNNQESQQNP